MKLLPPREVETQTRVKQSAESQRITAIRSHLSREELELNDWNDSIDKKKAAAIKDFEDKIAVYNLTVSDLQEKIAGLEEKREKLMRPLDADREEIASKLAATEDMLNYLQERKKELSEKKKVLEDTQQMVDMKLGELLIREDRIVEQEEDLKTRISAVNMQEKELGSSVESFMDRANKKNDELLLFERTLNGKEVELAARERLVAEGNERIVKEKMRIQSQQRSLINAMQDAKNKGII